jgi:hypothetical protein
MYESKSDRFLSLLSRVAYRTLAMRPRPPSKPRAGNDGTKKRDYSHAGVILLRYIKKERSDFTKRAKDQARKQQQQQPLGTRQDRQIGRVIYVSQSQRTAGPSILYPSGQTFLFIICLIFVWAGEYSSEYFCFTGRMYRRFEGEFVEGEENEIKQSNAGQESAAWFPLFLLEVYANYDVSNEPGYRAPAEKKNSQPQQQQQQQPNTYHLMFHFHICESIKDSSCVCVVFRISRLTLYKFGEREI